MSSTLLMFFLVSGLATSAGEEASDKNPKKGQATGKQSGKARSYGDDDLDRVAGRKPWSEQTEEERKRSAAAAGVTASPVVTPVSEAESRRGRKNEAGGEQPPEADGSSGQEAASEPSRPHVSPQVAALQARIERLESSIQSLDTQSRQLLERRLLSTDTSEILRLQAEQGEVQQRLEGARQELAQARQDLDSAQSAARR